MCTRTHMFMATKTITIMEDAYELLKQEKVKNESFSDVIRKVIPKKKSIWDFVGILSEEEGEELQETVKEIRKRMTKQMAERRKRFFGDDMPG